MPAIESMSFDAVCVVARLSQASVGVLLQTTWHAKAPYVVMKAQLPTATGPSLGIVLMEDTDAGPSGLFLSEGEADDSAALDLSDLADLAIKQPAAVSLGNMIPDMGWVCLIKPDAQAHFGLSVRTRQHPQIHDGYLVLSGPHRGYILKDRASQYIGRALVVPRGITAP